MSFNSFCNTYAAGIKIMEEIGLKKGINLALNGDTIGYKLNIKDLSIPAATLLVEHRNNVSDMLEAVLMSRIFSEGPKVFDVAQIDFEMLIQMEINVPMSEYNQPFPTYIIQLPDNFCKNRIVDCLQAGEIINGTVCPAKDEPDFVVLHHAKDVGSIVFGLFFKNTGMSIKTGFGLDPDNLIESSMIERHKQFAGSLEVSESEWKLVEELLRAAINYSLLIDEVGSRRLPNAHEERLKRHLEVAQKSLNRERIIRAETELRRYPVKYELNQEVQLYKSVDKLPSESEHSGRTMSPHHRRGHYRMQPYGPGRSQRRRIRIPPIFVNAHKFLGGPQNTKVTYK